MGINKSVSRFILCCAPVMMQRCRCRLARGSSCNYKQQTCKKGSKRCSQLHPRSLGAVLPAACMCSAKANNKLIFTCRSVRGVIAFGLVCVRNYRTRIVNCLWGLLLSLHLRYTPANMNIMILRSLSCLTHIHITTHTWCLIITHTCKSSNRGARIWLWTMPPCGSHGEPHRLTRKIPHSHSTAFAWDLREI